MLEVLAVTFDNATVAFAAGELTFAVVLLGGLSEKLALRWSKLDFCWCTKNAFCWGRVSLVFQTRMAAIGRTWIAAYRGTSIGCNGQTFESEGGAVSEFATAGVASSTSDATCTQWRRSMARIAKSFRIGVDSQLER